MPAAAIKTFLFSWTSTFSSFTVLDQSGTIKEIAFSTLAQSATLKEIAFSTLVQSATIKQTAATSIEVRGTIVVPFYTTTINVDPLEWMLRAERRHRFLLDSGQRATP